MPSLHCRKEMILQILNHGIEKYVSFTWNSWIKLLLFWGKNAKGSLVVWIRSLINTFKNIYINLHWLTNSLSAFHENFFSSNFFWKFIHIVFVHCVLHRAWCSQCSVDLKKPIHSSKRTGEMGWGRKLELRNLEGPPFYCDFFLPGVLFQHIFFFLDSVASLLEFLF